MRSSASHRSPTFSAAPPRLSTLESSSSSSLGAHGRHSSTSMYSANSSEASSSSLHKYPSYDSMSGGPMLQRDASMSSPYPSQHIGQPGVPVAKRAYRQRRKDPSCDACRERKVKCDATDTSSCSECSSRNVKCQFTKETNRRMSSIKQVQDLEKQLALARAQMQQLKSLSRKTSTEDSPTDTDVQNFDFSSEPLKHNTPPFNPHLSEVRTYIQTYSKGIFKPPMPFRDTPTMSLRSTSLTSLPPRDITDHILAQFNATVHNVIPIIHWPKFVGAYESLYQHGDISRVEPSWAAVFFAVLACGYTFTVEQATKDAFPYTGAELIEICSNYLGSFNDCFTLDHIRATLLTTIFLTEMNQLSVASAWLGSAIRMAQDIGLHRDIGEWSIFEQEMRRRVWWGVYVWDRLLGGELGRVLQINDEDCDTGLPSAVDDHFLFDEGIMAPGEPALDSLYLSTIRVARLISPLMRALRIQCLSPSTMTAFNAQFDACLLAFPPLYHPSQTRSLDARALSSIFYLQNARLILHRHNLSFICSVDMRHAAVTACANVALDTVRYLTRVMLPDARPWSHGIASSATTMICLHIWRCLLFLCFRRLWDDAIVCVQACTAIGSMRVINDACGRSMSAYLKLLRQKLSRNTDIEHDDELIAIVSADAQGSNTSAWIWTGGGQSTPKSLSNMPINVQESPEIDPALLREDEKRSPSAMDIDFEGWPAIESMILQLRDEQIIRDQDHNVNINRRTSANLLPSVSVHGGGGASRMAIHNII